MKSEWTNERVKYYVFYHCQSTTACREGSVSPQTPLHPVRGKNIIGEEGGKRDGRERNIGKGKEERQKGGEETERESGGKAHQLLGKERHVLDDGQSDPPFGVLCQLHNGRQEGGGQLTDPYDCRRERYRGKESTSS